MNDSSYIKILNKTIMKIQLSIKKTTIFIVCFLSFTIGFSQSLESKIDDLLNSSYKTNEPGATALVARNGEVIYRKAFGNSNLELDVEMIPENVFEIGSITKQFTAVSILMLLEQGKLSLDDEITKFLPEYPTHGKTITIHHLLTHTSGIKSYTNMQSFGEVVRKDMTPIEMIDFFKNEPMEFDPGEKYNYNNSGFFILGYIIEHISGMTYTEFLQENIFNPLNMTSSYYGSHTKLIENRASGYQENNGFANAIYISLSLPYAAGSIMSNVDDMLKWQTAINSNTLVKRETIKKAFTNYTLNNGEPINYGYGWSRNDLNGIPSIEHGGGIPGYTTMGIYVPSEDVYVIILTNCGCNSPSGVATKIAALAINKPYPTATNVSNLTQKQLEKWTGAYKFENDAIRVVSLKDGQLYSQRDEGEVYKIYPKNENEFYFEEGVIQYKFSMKDGKKTALFKNRINVSEGIETIYEAPAEKEVITVDAEILKLYVGKYELQPGFIIEITSEGNQLFAQATGQPQSELFATSTSSFFLKVTVASVDFISNENDEIVSLTLHQGGQDMEAAKIE